MKLGRRPFMRSGFAALAAATVASGKAVAAADQVYGAESVASTDLAALTVSIQQQVTRSGLPTPTLNLFPAEPQGLAKIWEAAGNASARVNEFLGMTTYSTQEAEQKGVAVTGLRGGQAGRDEVSRFAKDRTPGHVLSGSCECGMDHSRMSQDFPAFRVFAALHETTHFVSQFKGMDAPARDQALLMSPNAGDLSQDRDFQQNIRERIADVSASLYLLSNYKDAKAYLGDVKDLRNANLEPVHYTTSSINAGIAAFEKAPRRGMSIVDTTQMAVAIIGNQPKLGAEYKEAVLGFRAANTGAISTLDPVASRMVKDAVISRRAIFSPVRR